MVAHRARETTAITKPTTKVKTNFNFDPLGNSDPYRFNNSEHEYKRNTRDNDSSSNSYGWRFATALASMAFFGPESGTVGEERNHLTLHSPPPAFYPPSENSRLRGDEISQQRRTRYAGSGGDPRGDRPETPTRYGDFEYLHRTQTRYPGAQTGDQFTLAQSTHSFRPLQDDNYEGRQGCSHEELLVRQDRPEGMFLATSSEQKVSEIPRLPMGRQDLSVSGSPIWSHNSPIAHNQIISPSDRRASTFGPFSPNICGRYAGVRRHSSRMSNRNSSSPSAIQEIRSDSQRQEIATNPYSEDYLFRLRARQHEYDHNRTTFENSELQKRNEKVFEQAPEHCETIGFSPGEAWSIGRRAFSDTGTYGNYSSMESRYGQDTRLGFSFQSPDSSQKRHSLVGEEPSQAQWAPNSGLSDSNYSGGDGRKRPRVGRVDSITGPTEDQVWGHLHTERSSSPYQLQGTPGRREAAAQHDGFDQKPVHQSDARQHRSAIVHSQDGGADSPPFPHSPKDMGSYGPSQLFFDRDFSPRTIERGRGLPVSPPAPSGRIQVESEHFSSDRKSFSDKDLDRPLCDSRKFPGPQIFQLGTQPRLSRDRRPSSELEKYSRGHVCSPPVLSHPQSLAEGTGPGSNDHSRGSLLAGPTMVSSSGENVRGDSGYLTPTFSTLAPSRSLTEGKESTQQSTMVDSRLADIRLALTAKGFQASAIDQIEKSWAPSTAANYDRVWRKWATFCSASQVDRFSPEPNLVGNFQAQLIQEGLGEGSLENSLSALSSTFAIIYPGKESLFQWKSAKAQVKAAGAINKPKGEKWLQEIFDPSYVVEFFHSFSPDELPSDFKGRQIRLMQLMKLFLGARDSDLAGLLILSGLQRIENGYKIRFFDTKAAQHRFTPGVNIYYLNAELHNLCICSLIDELLPELQKIAEIALASDAGLFLIDDEDVVNIKGDRSLTTQDIPVFGYLKAIKNNSASPIIHKFTPYSTATIGHRAVDIFKSIIDDDKSPWSASFTSHNFRHALASQLKDMGVLDKDIAEFMQTGGSCLSSAYYLPVIRHWDLPWDCIKQADSLQAKLIVPFYHYLHASTSPSATCNCAVIIR